jgi:uncharacterized protein GlcG (DUF336 family)
VSRAASGVVLAPAPCRAAVVPPPRRGVLVPVTRRARLRLGAVFGLLGAITVTPATFAAEPLLVTYPSLTTAAALAAAQAALAGCRKDGYIVSVAVVDRGGVMLALLRDNLAGRHTPDTAVAKAATAASFRMDTRDLAEGTQPGKATSGIRALPGVVAVGGGIPIQAKGQLVGAIGVSGAPGGDADHACARAGVASIQDALELE